MTSTLADLQRRNLEKMEATDPPPTSPSSIIPSNEVSIIPSLTHSITPSSTHSSDGEKDDTIEGSHEGVKDAFPKLSREASSAGASSKGPKPSGKTAKQGPAQNQAPAQNPDVSLKDALAAQLREHLMEQLMPSGGKGPVTRLNVEMPEDLHQRLKQHCVKTRTPIKGLINALIALYLDAEGE